MDRQKTGALIAQMRKERGLTQRELAEQLHISDRTVSKWERGAGFPDVSMLIPLAPGAPSGRTERSLRFGGGRTARPGFHPAGPGLETSGAVETIYLRRPGVGRSGSVAGRLRPDFPSREPDLSRLGLSGRTAAGTDFGPLVRNASVSPALTLGVSRADPDSSGADYPGPGP